MRRFYLFAKPVMAATVFGTMLLLTVLGLDTSMNRFEFARTSAEYMMTIVSGPAVLQGLLLFAAGYCLFRLIRGPFTPWAGLFLAVALAWGLSGRKVGVLFSEGRVYAGWFHVQMNRFSLCVPEEDCETTIYRVTVTPLSYWRVRLSTAHTQRVLFVGPVNWHRTLAMLQQTFSPPYPN